MNTEIYKSILGKHIAALLLVVILGVMVCVAGIVLVKKLDLPKYLYVFCIGVLVIGIICAYDVVPMFRDLNNEAYVEYIGSFEQYAGSSWSRDSTMILDGSDMVLHSERMTLSYGRYNGRIVYAKHSRIVVDMEIFEQF